MSQTLRILRAARIARLLAEDARRKPEAEDYALCRESRAILEIARPDGYRFDFYILSVRFKRPLLCL